MDFTKKYNEHIDNLDSFKAKQIQLSKKMQRILDEHCDWTPKRIEGLKKELLNLFSVMLSFRVGDDVLIDKDYRTTVIDIDKENGDITVFDYSKKEIFIVKENRVSLTISNLT